MQYKSDFSLDTYLWRKPGIIIYLTYPINYHIIWAMKKEKVKYIITKTPTQISKVIDKLKDTPEWKRTAKRFSRKAMEVISKL